MICSLAPAHCPNPPPRLSLTHSPDPLSPVGSNSLHLKISPCRARLAVPVLIQDTQGKPLPSREEGPGPVGLKLVQATTFGGGGGEVGETDRFPPPFFSRRRKYAHGRTPPSSSQIIKPAKRVPYEVALFYFGLRACLNKIGWGLHLLAKTGHPRRGH